MAGILGYGIYVPRFRVKTAEIRKAWGGGAPGIQEKSVPYFDEDPITMAVQAARNGIEHCSLSPDKIGGLFVGSVSSPYIIKSMAVLVGTVLGISESAIMADFGGSTRSSTLALISCLDAVHAGRLDYGLVIGSDFIVPEAGTGLEHSLGAGAGALLIGKEKSIVNIDGFGSYSNEYGNTWQIRGKIFPERHEDFRIEIQYGLPLHAKAAAEKLFNELKFSPGDVHHLALSQPDTRVSDTAAKSLKLRPQAFDSGRIVEWVGDTGSSSMFLSLAKVLDKAKVGEKILAISYGAGSGSDAFMLTVRRENGDGKGRNNWDYYLESKEYVDYVRYAKLTSNLAVKRMLPEPMSAFIAQPPGLRGELNLTLKAAKCKKCGSVNFPPRLICIETGCRSRDFDVINLPSRRGVIETFNIQYVLAVDPEEPPLAVCHARMDGCPGEYGGKISAMITEADPKSVAIGKGVELVFRKCGSERGLIKYGYKFKIVN